MMRAREDVKTGNSGPARQRKFKDPDTKHLLDSSKYHTPLETLAQLDRESLRIPTPSICWTLPNITR